MPPKRRVDLEDVLERLASLEKCVTKLQAWRQKMKQKKREERKERGPKKGKAENSKKRRKSETLKEGKRRRKDPLALPPTPVPENSVPATPKPKVRRRGSGKFLALPPTPMAMPPTPMVEKPTKTEDVTPQAKKRGRPPKAPLAQAVDDPAEVKVETEKAKVSASDPTAELCCYDVLEIPRAATVEQVKRAFRSLALKLHPDKGGDQKAFCCLTKAFDTLQDKVERAAYDRRLVQSGSRDGLSGTSSGAEAAAEQVNASPLMLRDAFLSCNEGTWDELLGTLTDLNLQALKNFLQLPLKKQSELAKSSDRSSASGTTGRPLNGTTGICRSGNQYYGKASLEGISITSRPSPDLAAALDARMALQQLKASVRERMEAGQDFDTAVRASVAIIRSLEQSSVFYIKFSFDYNDRTCGTRRQTPNTTDVETMLDHRRRFLQIREADMKTKLKKDEYAAAHELMKSEAKALLTDSLVQLHMKRALLLAKVEKAWAERSQNLGAIRPLLAPRPRLAITWEEESEGEKGSDPSSSSSDSDD